MTNNKIHNHGVLLLYPFKREGGIAMGWFKAGRKANKVFYFVGMAVYVLLTCLYALANINTIKVVEVIAVLAYMVIILHFVRVKSEKEQRHIMHMRGEI